MDEKQGMRIEYISHACLSIDTETRHRARSLDLRVPPSGGGGGGGGGGGRRNVNVFS